MIENQKQDWRAGQGRPAAPTPRMIFGHVWLEAQVHVVGISKSTKRISCMNICWRLARLLWVLCALACFQLPLAYAVTLDCPAPPSGTAPMQLPAGGFGIDGDAQANTPGIGIGDWVPDPTGSGGAVLTSAGVPLDPTTTFHLIDAYGGIDTNFKSGLKVDDDPNTWSWIINPTTAKDDLNNALIHVSADSSGHRWLVLSADRAINNGDSYIDFEFLQRPLSVTTNADGISGGFTSAGPQGGRTTNDFLLTMTFTKGGTAAAVCVSRWQPSGSGFDYVDATAALPPGSIFGAVNTSIIPVPYGAFGTNTYDVNTFAEVAVDVTVLLGGFDPCLSVGVKTIMVKTKTSQSPQATIVDFIAPLSLDLRLGPGVDAGTGQAKCMEGASTTFTLNGAAYPGVDPIVSTNWSVVFGSATIDSPNSLTSAVQVSSTSATLRLTMVDGNGCTKSDDVVLSVNPLPPGSITGPDFVLASNNTYSGPDGMDSYSWSISGNGTISGPTSSQAVDVTAGSACGQKFDLMLTVTKNGCSSTFSQSFSVPDISPPVIGDAGADATIECPITPVFTPPTATDACDPNPRIVEVSDVTTPSACAGSYTRTKSWKAVDADGNESGTKSQSISVRDNTAPVISDAGANATIDCPNTPVFTSPAATDVCDPNSVIVEISDVTTPGVLAGSYTRTKTWKAVDACGNESGIKSQAITVRDNTAPVLSAPGANATIDCPSTPVFTPPTATDACDPNPRMVEVSDVTTPGNCPGSYTRTKTWKAVDACDNESGTMSQTITVRDNTAPVISHAGAEATINCPSTPVFTPPTATDACDPNPRIVEVSDITTPGALAGSYKRTKTWKAVDAGGNESATKSQTITVTDNTAPVITCPTSRAVGSSDSTDPSVTGTAKAVDNCDPVPKISYIDNTAPGNCPNTMVIARTWTASDSCGNSSSCVQTITVSDTPPPVIICPPRATVQGDTSIDPIVTGQATATIISGPNPTLSYSDDATGTCTKVIARTWTVTDCAGNQSQCLQTITVMDTAAPILTCPSDKTVEEYTSTDPNVTGRAAAVDDCDPAPAISYSDVTSGASTRIITRTWSVTDCAGNQSRCVQTITVTDSPSEGTLITDSLRCTLPNNQLRLIFTQDLKNMPCYKLTASNPGQFYYNVFYSATPGSSATFHVSLPYPWVTQGARPIEVYDGVTVQSSGSQTCLAPGNKISAGSQHVTLSNYGSNPVMGVTTYTLDVTVTVPATGFVFLAVHLDHGLKASTGYGQDAAGDATACANTGILIPNNEPYTFSVGGAASGSATVSSYNAFKNDSVVRGAGQSQITTFSVAGATAVLKNAKGTVLDSEVSDQDGRCIFNYRYASKAATFYVTLIPPAGFGTAQTKAITLKPNGNVEVDFTTP